MRNASTEISIAGEELQVARATEADLRSQIEAKADEVSQTEASLQKAVAGIEASKREMSDLSAELSRYKSHAAIAISQRDEELQQAQQASRAGSEPSGI